MASSLEVHPDRVAAMREEDSQFILDVRRPGDYEEWRVEGTDLHLPIYDELLDGEYGGLERALDRIPEDRTIHVVCVAGITSARAARFLQDRGYDARSMADGMRGWGRVHEAFEVEGVDGVVQVVRPGTGCVSHLVFDAGEAVVVDPSMYTERYRTLADDRDLEIVGVLDTHAHADHVSGARTLAAELNVPYYLHADDAGRLEDYAPIADGDAVPVGDRALSVLHTPGHTPGSVSLRYGSALLSGDTLFLSSVGRPDLEDGDDEAVRAAARDLFDSLDRLRALPDDTLVLPGHFTDASDRPLARALGSVAEDNRLFGVDDREAFVESIVGSLPETPANYERIKRVNWGKEPVSDEVADLELGPNNCAAN